MKALDSFTVEEIEEIISSCQQEIHNTPTSDEFPVSPRLLLSLARIALAAKRAEESHSRREVWDGGNTWIQCSKQAYDRHEAAGKRVRVLYERPQLNSPVIPKGWKLVPAEITSAMRDAWDSAPNCHEDDDVNMCNAYRAMLAAAPEKPL
ncbi:hypothetical protein OP862_15685 [Yersinia massiliensis]|uniref:hypothetical protein n=1 Tax=Yersinia massiliensis TaxID=419257 RepID=UPI00223E9348|nr:hypothetical protein [Yersinia massiliensis]MDA5547568.1 hypothetical protein [Yersinia massiliensis]UZM77974.1 hypothetical protein OP862_15685 [Yersinia massiliensis]